MKTIKLNYRYRVGAVIRFYWTPGGKDGKGKIIKRWFSDNLQQIFYMIRVEKPPSFLKRGIIYRTETELLNYKEKL